MKNTQHTPGPWESVVPPSSLLTTRHIKTENGELIAEVGVPGCGGVGTIQDVSNARLIAAAPELLEACRVCATATTRAQWEQGQALASSAIARATGNQ